MRFLGQLLLLASVALALYLGAFWVLCNVEVGGTPVIYRTSKALHWKGGNSHRKFREFDREARYDAVFLGSSHAYRGYDPVQFAEQGYHTFNLGTSGQSVMNSYFILTEYLTKENTALLVLDVYAVAFELDGVESTADLTQNITSDRAAVHMALALRDPRGLNMLTLRWLRRHAPPMYEDPGYRPGGSTLKPDTVQGEVHYVHGRGFDPDPMQRRHLRRLFAHCQREGIPVVLVDHPAPKASDRAKDAAFKAFLAREVEPYGWPLIDMAFDHGLDLDDRRHFYDHNHLNSAGVALFNEALIERLRGAGLLPAR